MFETVAAGRHIRPVGLDFAEGDHLLAAGRVLDPAALSLAAAANHARVPVIRRPLVAILATGDELLPPGSSTGPDQIIASNGYGVAAIARLAGADVLDLGIAPDRVEAIERSIAKAIDAGADIIVTLGGASVGDHDLVHNVFQRLGMRLDFWKIAMRPGKPLMYRPSRQDPLSRPARQSGGQHRLLAPVPEAATRPARADFPSRMRRHRPDSAPTCRPTMFVRTMYEPGSITHAARRGRDTLRRPGLLHAQDPRRRLGLIIREPFAPPAHAGETCRVLRLR